MITERTLRDAKDLMDHMERDLRNRQNAQKSTGPKTPEGKAVSRMNALRHGLCATVVLAVPEEDRAAFEQLRKGMYDSFKPADVAEATLVDHYISISWKLRRVGDAEAAANQREMNRPQPRTIAEQLLDEACDDGHPIRTRFINLEEKLQRMLGRTLKQIKELRQMRQAQREAGEAALEVAADPPAPTLQEVTSDKAEPAVKRPETPVNVQQCSVGPNEPRSDAVVAAQTKGNVQNEPTAPVVEARVRTPREIAGY